MTETAPRKRRNAEQTKANILAAAQKSFSELGYPQAGIRDIAAIAGVSSTMLLHYFGSKAGLFEAALTDAMKLEGIESADRGRVGEMLAQALLGKGPDITTTSMIMLASSDPEAREIAMRIAKEQAIATIAKWLGPPDADARALEIFLLTTGFIFYTKNMPLLDDKKNADATVAQWLAQAIQHIVDQSG